MQLESPPSAPPSLVRRDYLRAQHQHTLELQDNVHISAVVLIDTHLTRWWIVKRWLPRPSPTTGSKVAPVSAINVIAKFLPQKKIKQPTGDFLQKFMQPS